jgi:hypothetical protein
VCLIPFGGCGWGPAGLVASGALLVFMVDVIIIFALTTYGGRDRYNLAG